MEDYKTYLAENILSEDKVVTYRLLSRALRVHPNVAKQMLHDFHKTQSSKKPGTVYATYLLYGIKKSVQNHNGNAMDIDLPSSLPDADPVDDEEVPSYTLVLVQEERLADVLKEYETISSIHVYSVGPHPAKDLTLLVDAAQSALAIKDDAKKPRPRPIVNSHVRRRERKGLGLEAAAPAKQESKTKAAPTKTAPAKPSPAPASAAAPAKPQEESKSAAPAMEPEAPTATTKKPAPSLKRNTSAASGIMQAFSKAASLPKKAKTSEKSITAAEETPAALSDDGEDDDDVPLPKPGAVSTRKSKKEREEELRRMMEDDEDEDMEETADSPAPEEEEEEEPVVEEPPAKAEVAEEEEKEIVTTTGDGRRRGKRRVMKKKQIMDDQGYLVTIQEPAWESFSEDEAPPAAKPKPKVTNSAPPAAAGKAKKPAPKGQGNIMSFFSKK
ncbi:DNA polymerase subunit Cdc27 [Neurospora intermedia]|uniref:DNA polymerase delta subunit 3 n=1 Tax=Neurospora intermedia TaxID=5142 RepID=A0ABR3DGT3_NEUIN